MTGIILAHGSAQEAFDYNISTWSNWFDEMIVICPEDDQIKYPGLKIYPYGQSEHSGYWCCERFRYACQLASTKKSACILEYDTLLFGTAPVPENGKLKACGPMYDDHFKTKWYSHSPWMASKKDFGRISKYDGNFMDIRYGDRWLAAVCEDLNIEAASIGPHYTPPTGNTNDYTSAIELANGRSNMNVFHGIKNIDAASKIILAKNRFTADS